MEIAPSILSFKEKDFKQLNKLENITLLHVDIMDGCFVPNTTFDHQVVSKLKEETKFILDVHLMINEPIKYVSNYALAGSDIITFHYEAVDEVYSIINEIKKYQKKVGISIKPNTNVYEIEKYLNEVDLVLVMSVEPGFGGQKFLTSAIEKIDKLYNYRKDNNLNYVIEVDGGINEDTIKNVTKCDYIVAGSYIFNSEDYNERIRKLYESCNSM